MNVGEVKVKMYDNGTALVQWCDSRGEHSKVLQPGDTFSADFGIRNWIMMGDSPQ